MVQLDDSKDEQSNNTKTVCDIAVPDGTREEINTQEEISVTSADDSGDHSSEINDLSDDKAGPCETWYSKKRFQEGKDKLTENPRISMAGKKNQKTSTKVKWLQDNFMAWSNLEGPSPAEILQSLLLKVKSTVKGHHQPQGQV